MFIKKVNSGTTEKQVEAYLVAKVKKAGGIAYKFTSPMRRAVPDRLCVLPNGVSVFVEVKAPGKRPTVLQEKELQRLKDLGQLTTIVDSKASIDHLMTAISWRIKDA